LHVNIVVCPPPPHLIFLTFTSYVPAYQDFSAKSTIWMDTTKSKPYLLALGEIHSCEAPLKILHIIFFSLFGIFHPHAMAPIRGFSATGSFNPLLL